MINNRIYKGLGHPSKNRTDELYLANLKEKILRTGLLRNPLGRVHAHYTKGCVFIRGHHGGRMLYGGGNMEASGEKKTLDIIHKKTCIKTA